MSGQPVIVRLAERRDLEAVGRLGALLLRTHDEFDRRRWLAAHGVPRVLLWRAAPNAAAQRLSDRLGFRRTMIEMTREM